MRDTLDRIKSIIIAILMLSGGAFVTYGGLGFDIAFVEDDGEPSVFMILVGAGMLLYGAFATYYSIWGINKEQEMRKKYTDEMEEKRIAAQKAAENYRRDQAAKRETAQRNNSSKNDDEEKGTLKPLDSSTRTEVEKYIEKTYGTKYVTQEQEKEDRKRAEEVKRKAKEAEQQKDDPELQQITSSPDIRYSISTVEDRDFLSKEADKFYSIKDPKTNKSFQVPSGMTQYMNFTELLRFYINASGMESTEIYRRANLSKSVYSALFAKGHIPKKGTVIALAIALRLDLLETERLLMKAGYTFSNTIKGDLIAVYFINHKIYDIDRLNGALYEYGEPILGSKAY